MIQGPRGTQIDGAADAAFYRGSLRRLEHVGAGNHVGGQDVEGEIAAVVIGREDAIVERGDVVLRTQAANADILPFAAGGAVDRDAGDML